MSDMDSKALFEAAMSDPTPAPEAVQPEPAPATPEYTQGQPRDEHGRFAQKAAEQEQPAPAVPEPAPEPQAAAQEQNRRDHQVPLVELLNEREKRQKYEREMEDLRRQFEAAQAQWRAQQQQQRQQPEAPDIFENPAAYTSHLESTFAQKMREQELNFSLRLAHREYKQEFEEAYAALERRGQMGDAATVQSVVNSPDPGEAIVRWHRQQKLYEQTGGNLDAWMQKQREQLLNDPAFLAQAVEKVRASTNGGTQHGQRPNVQLPPSLNKVASAASPTDSPGSMSNEALFHAALR